MPSNPRREGTLTIVRQFWLLSRPSLFALKTVSGFSLLAWRAADPDRARADIAELTSLFETGTLHAAVETLPLAEAARAHRLLEDRAVLGRLLLVP